MQNYVCKGYAGISILNYWCRSVAHETLLFQTGQALWGGVSCSQITVKSNEIFRASVLKALRRDSSQTSAVKLLAKCLPLIIIT